MPPRGGRLQNTGENLSNGIHGLISILYSKYKCKHDEIIIEHNEIMSNLIAPLPSKCSII